MITKWDDKHNRTAKRYHFIRGKKYYKLKYIEYYKKTKQKGSQKANTILQNKKVL